METATFGAGCFWGVEANFSKIRGVIATKVGYMGGKTNNPTYEDVCTDKTGHVEVVEIKYDPNIIGYKDLLDFFWKIHDPTQKNRQGPDIGTQYRSVIFYHNDKQKEIALKSKENLSKTKIYTSKIVTDILPAKILYPAEEYHQNYFEKQKKFKPTHFY